MNKDNLIHMANQIGQFFESMPDRSEAEAGIINHIKKFWEPRMRRAFLAAIDDQTAGELRDIVKTAVASHRAELA
jgi:formate dehydrogenase subunit delta